MRVRLPIREQGYLWGREEVLAVKCLTRTLPPAVQKSSKNDKKEL